MYLDLVMAQKIMMIINREKVNENNKSIKAIIKFS